MKENIKTEILETSRQLFNKHGFASVPMRKIASECNISVGNLTYHYPHKLDILCALMEDIQPKMEVRDIHSLTTLISYLRQMLDGIKKNAFFFTISDMQRINEECFEINAETIKKLHQNLITSLNNLLEDGILQVQNADDIFEDIVSFWMLSHITWTNEDYQKSVYKQTNLYQFLLQHLTLLSPYMTQSGKDEYKKLKEKLQSESV